MWNNILPSTLHIHLCVYPRIDPSRARTDVKYYFNQQNVNKYFILDHICTFENKIFYLLEKFFKIMFKIMFYLKATENYEILFLINLLSTNKNFFIWSITGSYSLTEGERRILQVQEIITFARISETLDSTDLSLVGCCHLMMHFVIH